MFVYILQSEKDKNFYVGMSANPKKRLEQHNEKKVRSTKYRTPLRLVYSEKFDTVGEARRREKHLKSYRGAKEKIEILQHCGIV